MLCVLTFILNVNQATCEIDCVLTVDLCWDLLLSVK